MRVTIEIRRKWKTTLSYGWDYTFFKGKREKRRERKNHSFKTRPGPRPGFRVLTGSPGRPGHFF